MRKSINNGVSVLLSIIIVSAGISACSMPGANTDTGSTESTEAADSSIEVSIAKPVIRDVSIRSNFSATVEAADTVTVIPKVAGEVIEKYFEIGDHVREGDLLFKIDDEMARLQVDNAKATVDSASAGYTAQQATNASTKAQATETIAKISSNELQLDAAVNSAYAQKRSAGNTFESQVTSEEYYENEYYEAKEDLHDMKKKKKKLKQQKNSLGDLVDSYKSKVKSDGEAKANDWLKTQGYDSAKELTSAYEAAASAYSAADSAVDQYENSIQSYDLQKRTSDFAADSAEMNFYSAEDNVAIAEQNRQIYNNFTKATTLFGVNAQVVGADASLVNSEATLRQAKVGLENAKMTLEDYTVTAPVSGIITNIGITLHNMASSATEAYTIESDTRNKIVFYVAEGTVQSIAPGNDAIITKNGEEYAAKIVSVGSTLDPDTGLFKIEAMMNDYKTEFLNGSTVSVKTVTRESKDAITVPIDSVYYDDEQAYVFVSEGGKALRRDIEIGISDDDGIVVTKGLSKKDDVVVSWSSQLKDGVPIKVTEEKDLSEDGSGTSKKTAVESTEESRITDPSEITAGEASTEINPDAVEGSVSSEEE